MENEQFRDVLNVSKGVKGMHAVIGGSFIYHFVSAMQYSFFDLQYLHHLQKIVDLLAMSQVMVAGGYLAFSVLDYNQDKYDLKYLKQLAPQKVVLAGVAMAGAVGQICLMDQLHLGYYFLFFVPSQYLLYRDYEMSKEGTCPQMFYNFKTAYHTYMMLYMTLGLFTLLNYKASRRKQSNCLQQYNGAI